MQKKIFVMLFVIGLISCRKENIIEKNCIEISQNATWKIENFKREYAIQIPDNYEGVGMVGFEGNVYSKKRTDNKVELSYSFCGPLFCNDFGENLSSPFPQSILAKDKTGKDIVLMKQKEFCTSEKVTGVFYSNNLENAFGKFYLSDNEVFKEALTVSYVKTEQLDVEEILRTIRKR
jgi:hypothetical protein